MHRTASVWFQLMPEGLRATRVNGVSSSLKAGSLETRRGQMFPSESEGQGRPMSQRKQPGNWEFFLTQSSYSIQGFNGLNEAHAHLGGQSALLHLLILMLLSTRNTLIDTNKSNI